MKALALLAILLGCSLLPQQPVPRPRILGVAHFAVFVSSLPKSRAFYQDLLGYETSLTLTDEKGPDGTAFMKINEHQSLELLNQPSGGEGQLDHIALYTDDADRMRDYLALHGVPAPDKVGKDRLGNKTFTVKDPDGHKLEILEYQRDSWTATDAGKHLPASRLSDHAIHVGILVGNLDRAMKFYNGVLGFQEFWRGAAANSQTLSWVNMRVPDGTDYVEFMLYREMPPPQSRGSAHHMCLLVPDVEEAVRSLGARPSRKDYSRPIEIRTGINRKRQVNLFDPDGTRVELMEPNTIDGKLAPSSTLPPPQ